VSPHDGPAAAPDPVGSVADEATKLLQALQGWARDNGGHDTDASTAEATSTTHRLYHLAAAGGVDAEGVAADGEDCRYCPLCRAISVVRGTPPEVRQHLVSAATSLMHAAAELLATPVPGQQPGGPESSVNEAEVDDEDEREVGR
jgi:hypothetical protein